MGRKEQNKKAWSSMVKDMHDHYIRRLLRHEYKITDREISALMIRQKRRELTRKRERWGRTYE